MGSKIKIIASVVLLLFTLESCRNESTISGESNSEKTIMIKGVLDDGITEQELYLFSWHAGFDLGDDVAGQDVALLDVDFVNRTGC